MRRLLYILSLLLSITFSFAQNVPAKIYPKNDIANKSPLQSLLGANEVFTAGDFPVTVITVEGSNGIYSGTGYIVVPYLADTKVKVSFNNIKLNTDKKLIEGVIETTYDPTEKNIQDASDAWDDLKGLYEEVKVIITNVINKGFFYKNEFEIFEKYTKAQNDDTTTLISNLKNLGLLRPDLQKEIEEAQKKVDSLKQKLNCQVKENTSVEVTKPKGSNDDDFSLDDDCKKAMEAYKEADDALNKAKEKARDEACIWNIAPDENLKGKTFYFQTSEKNNDGEGKKMYKLKAGDYPLSFNKNNAVYTFMSNGKIYRPFSDNSYYFSKDSDDKYAFENGKSTSLVDIKVDKNSANGISINNLLVTAGRDCSTDNKDKGNGLEGIEDAVAKANKIIKDNIEKNFPEKEVQFTVLDKNDSQYQQKLNEAQKQANYVIATIDQQGKVEIKSSFKVPEWFANALPDIGKQPEENCSNEYINVGLDALKNKNDYKDAPRSAQIAMEMGVIAYRGVFGTLYCMTDEKKFANASPANQFVGGAMHEAIATFDVAQIVEGVISLVKSGVEQQIMSPVTYYNNLKEISTQGFDTNDDVKFAKQVMGVVLLPPSNAQIEQIEKGVQVAKQLYTYYADCGNLCWYRYGEASVIVIPAVISGGSWAAGRFALKYPALANKALRTIEVLQQNVNRLWKLERKAGKLSLLDETGKEIKNYEQFSEFIDDYDNLPVSNIIKTIDDLVDESEMLLLEKDIKYLPGPQLPEKIAETFTNFEYTNRKLINDEIFYKYHGTNNRTGRKYAWYSKKKYTTELELRQKLAIKEDWGIQIDFVSEFNVPSGTWVSEGKAAAQGIGYPGQDYQAVILNTPNSWIIRTDKAFK